MNHLLEEISKLAASKGYRVEERRDSILVWHPNAPLALRVTVHGDNVIVELYSPGLRDYLDDLIEQSGGEEAREQLEEILDDLSELHALIEALLRHKGLKLHSRFKDNVLDILEAFEDVSET